MNRDTKFLLGVLAILSVLALIGLVLVSGGNGNNPQQTTTPATNATVSEEVERVYPLALELDTQMNGYFNDVEVYVSNEGEIAMTYQTGAENSGELKKEMRRIAVEYASISDENSIEPPTLSIISGQVQMLVPKPTVQSYVRGDINKEAFLETLEVIDVENNSTGK